MAAARKSTGTATAKRPSTKAAATKASATATMTAPEPVAAAPAKPKAAPKPRAKAAAASATLAQPTFTHEQVARRAFEIWMERGRPIGQDAENWSEAERQLRSSSRN